MVAGPPVRYARTPDGLDLAYWTLGRGPVLLHTPNVQLGHVRSEWSIGGMRSWYETLARHFTLVRYDHRGAGLSSRGRVSQSVDELVSDIEAVADAAGAERFGLLGWIAGGVPAIAYAARRPERVSHLVLWNAAPRDASKGNPRLGALFQMAAADWELFSESISHAALGWLNGDEARRWASVIRDGTTREEFLAYLRARRAWDVTAELDRVRAATLVVHDPDNPLADEERSRELARAIPGAAHVVAPSGGVPPGGECVAAIERFFGVGPGEADGLEGLTRREREVLALLAEGATNGEIAERLFISVNTVTRHLTHIYAKTGTRRRSEAVRYALRRKPSAT